MTEALRKSETSGKRANATESKDEVIGVDGDPIGQHLRRAYDGVAGEPVPERLQELLDALRRKEAETSKASEKDTE